ncbi:unnamed protein product [Acanthoscelides obtectus]|uniref:DUF4817 domain-containing protein n=1 Tax=Acanthoscelides obtectus TaxID=200917 RepID=A0A9P0P6R9_ACAOB|nr:unnamed protein product [Acanthoscelides obtectus]CAK1656704.1 hypothetical protein AOBTE_LOCUS19876 [Acanthoscelides obtectus]
MYIENRRSVVLTQRAYRRKYRGKQAPSDNTIRRLVPNFLEYGTVGDRQHTDTPHSVNVTRSSGRSQDGLTS